MLKILPALLLISSLTSPALADACDTLISTVENGLANPASTPFSKEQLDRLLEAGRAAKQSGNLQACEAAMQSPAPGKSGGNPGTREKKCDKTPNTV